jgi:Carboxypeptidase regulatory-like domain
MRRRWAACASSCAYQADPTRTSEVGSFRFPPLPPGTYALTVTRDGFMPTTRQDIYLAAGFTATVDVTLGLQAVAEVARVCRVVD